MWPRPAALAAAAAARAWRGARPASSSPSPPPHWLGEVRRYTLHPAAAAAFLAATAAPAALALRHRLPFVGMWTAEAGGSAGSPGGISLHTITHLYLYPSPADRTAARAAVAAQPGWGAFLAASWPAVAHQAADLLAVPAAQAVALMEAVGRRPGGGGGDGGGDGGGVGGGGNSGAPGLFELATGAPPGAHCPTPPGADLLLSGRILAGEGVGSGLQLWRHASLEACLDPLLAAGGGADAAAGAGSCRVLLRPVAWSPLQ